MDRRDVAVGLALVGVVLGLASAAFGAPRAQAAFGFSSLTSSFADPDGQATVTLPAGAHPRSWTTTLAFNTAGPPGEEHPEGELRDLRITFPPGLVGNTALLERCSRAAFAAGSCPPSTRVGAIALLTGNQPEPLEAPAYLLEPLPGLAAQLGIRVEKQVPVLIDLSIAPRPPHNLVAEVDEASQGAELFGATLTLEGAVGGAPFLTLPRSCPSPLTASFAASSWTAPQVWVSAETQEPQTVTGCGSLAYAPDLRLRPTTTVAAAPSGLDLDLDVPDPGIGTVDGRAAADTRSATVLLPPGMTLNPSSAAELAGCTSAELAAERPDSDPRTGCPEAAKIGSASISTPLFEEPFAGDVYVAQPDDPATTAPGAENPYDALLALYLVVRDPERGVLLSLPIRVTADPADGRLTAHFDQIPALPLDHLSLRFNSGPRAPLRTPPTCGDHAIGYSLEPSSGNPLVAGVQRFETTSGCDVSFAPRLSVGSVSPRAGSAAPFVLELRNGAGAPNLAGLRLTLPPGLAADLTAATTCPEAAAAIAACPPGSRLGYARVAVGAGPEPLWVPGGADPASSVHLAGPHDGAPYSLLISVPAAAGPFDLGRVVLRAPLRIDPDTAQVSVEVDDLPQVRDGIPLHYRAIRLVLDRPGFLRNPTSCEPLPIELTATAASGAEARVGDRFQAEDCAALRFRPRLAIRLSGALGRNGHPRIDLRISPRPGQAALAAASFDLPAGELLDTRRLGALCARDLPPARCPAASRLGRASLRSPLLPAPLSGPIYLRAPSRRYPDLVADLRGGGVRVLAHGRTASAFGGRLRIRLDRLPDIPLSRASLFLAGGRRGIVVNSAPLCSRPRRAAVMLSGHNGRELRVRPRIRLDGRC